MAENTVEVYGVQFNAENLLAAVEDVIDEPMGEGSAQYGNVIVDDDGYDDRIVNIVNVSTTHVLPHINPTKILNKCEEAIEQPFEDIVSENILNWYEVDIITDETASHWGFGYDCIIQCELGFITDTVQNLIQDDRIAVGQFAGKGDDNMPTIGLNDNR